VARRLRGQQSGAEYAIAGVIFNFADNEARLEAAIRHYSPASISRAPDSAMGSAANRVRIWQLIVTEISTLCHLPGYVSRMLFRHWHALCYFALNLRIRKKRNVPA
jgi:hypothetical protein